MHILLPPSETKRLEGGNSYLPETIAHADALSDARSRVRQAVAEVSRYEATAVKALGLGVKNRDERLLNLTLDTSGAMPAIERYTGVLYDALDVHSLDDDARSWIFEHVSVQSALFGLVAASDPIPAYRLSASSRLPTLHAPLKRVWAEAHASIAWGQFGWVLDLRSKDYVALAPLDGGAGVWLNVAQRGPDGEVRALNHFNKRAKGELVRRLALTQAKPQNAEEFMDWAAAHRVQISHDKLANEMTLITEALVATR